MTVAEVLPAVHRRHVRERTRVGFGISDPERRARYQLRAKPHLKMPEGVVFVLLEAGFTVDAYALYEEGTRRVTEADPARWPP